MQKEITINTDKTNYLSHHKQSIAMTEDKIPLRRDFLLFKIVIIQLHLQYRNRMLL
jgi:hypothetical protein